MSDTPTRQLPPYEPPLVPVAPGALPADKVAQVMKPPPSPNGTPVIGQVLVTAGTTLVAIAAVLVPVLPEHTLAYKACVAIVGLGAAFGIASPGKRKKAKA